MAVTLAYSTWGEGSRPLVLLHGFTGNRTSFDHLRPLLGGSVKAIAVDLPGHGETPLPRKKGREGFIETVEAVIELVEKLGWPRWICWATRWGRGSRSGRRCTGRSASAG